MGLAPWEGEDMVSDFSSLIELHPFSIENISREMNSDTYQGYEVKFYPYQSDLNIEESILAWIEENLPTYLHKGGHDLQFIEMTEEDEGYSAIVEFNTENPGYGVFSSTEDAPDLHSIEITVVDNTVTEAINNEEFDELNQQYIDFSAAGALLLIEEEAGEEGLNVREGPSVEFPSIARAESGGEFPVLGEEGNWYQIEIEGEEGWVSKSFSSLQTETEIEEVEDRELAMQEEDEDFGLFYSLVEDRLIFTTSMEAITEIISRIEE